MTLRDLILGASYRPVLDPVAVPQWPGTGGKLFVRSLSALDFERYLKISERHERDDAVCFLAEVTALVLVDDQGVPIFTSAEDAKALAGKDAEPLRVVVDAFTAQTKRRNAERDAKKKPTPLTTPPSSDSPSIEDSHTPTA